MKIPIRQALAPQPRNLESFRNGIIGIWSTQNEISRDGHVIGQFGHGPPSNPRRGITGSFRAFVKPKVLMSSLNAKKFCHYSTSITHYLTSLNSSASTFRDPCSLVPIVGNG